jgi:hypothetical protein
MQAKSQIARRIGDGDIKTLVSVVDPLAGLRLAAASQLPGYASTPLAAAQQ